MDLSSFNFSWWAPKDARFLKQTACVMALQGHPRSILAPIESAYMRFPIVINSNLGPILPGFRDIAGFLRRATPPLFHQNFGVFPFGLDYYYYYIIVQEVQIKNTNTCTQTYIQKQINQHSIRRWVLGYPLVYKNRPQTKPIPNHGKLLIISARSTISLSTSSLHQLAKSISFLVHEAHRPTSCRHYTTTRAHVGLAFTQKL